ncbi:transcription initiation factor TFIID subunit 11 [Drosophila sechellia]|uniref:GM19098 n=1 Tax=Drosophila sechellia TaxID=7238 RepID=B4I974_DROSE|nr:transcription initiation factor TFIID subunit 11 [Drosophila sechellia]EDW43755.1 GM19098 [Drosophila sechellia]
MSVSNIAGIELASGPTCLKSRICVRNLPPCTREELSLLCVPYGQIVGSLVIDTYGFIQFESLTEANRAIESLDHFLFKSKVLQVSNASISSLKATFSGTAPQKRRRIEWSDADDVLLVERIDYEDDEDDQDGEDGEDGEDDEGDGDDKNDKDYVVEDDSESDDDEDEGQKSRSRKRKRKQSGKNKK